MSDKKPSPGRLLLRWLLRLLGPALLVYILWQNADQLDLAWQTLRNVHWPPLIAVIFLVIPFILLKGWRWQIILRDLGQQVPWAQATLYYALGIFVGTATPGQAGDTIKAWYLKEAGYDLGAGLLSSVIDRLFDLFITGLLLLSGLYLLWQYFPGATLVLLLLGLLGGIGLALSLLLSRRWRDLLIDRVLRYLIPERIRQVLREHEARAYLDRFFLRWPSLLLCLAISLVSFATTLFRLWLLLPALGKSLPLTTFLPTMAIMYLGSLASVAGLGTREAVLLAVLTPLGWQEGEVLSFSALVLCVSLENLLLGLPLYWLKPLGTGRTVEG
ncbi:MAG: flippase-like domain-containing protein [Chloroflexia bacterium]|nr:flippase-like domain-containing protein [Chloroflexia bacterium]